MKGDPTSADAKAIELQHYRILGDMDFHINELLEIDGSLLAFKEMLYGQEPANVPATDAPDPEPHFLAQRELKHERIIELLNMIRAKLNRIGEF